MSEKLIKFLLSELKTVRVHCRHKGCGAIIEIPTADLGRKFGGGHCPICQQLLQLPGDNNGFIQLAEAVKNLTGAKSNVEVEFALPEKSAV